MASGTPALGAVLLFCCSSLVISYRKFNLEMWQFISYTCIWRDGCSEPVKSTVRIHFKRMKTLRRNVNILNAKTRKLYRSINM